MNGDVVALLRVNQAIFLYGRTGVALMRMGSRKQEQFGSLEENLTVKSTGGPASCASRSPIHPHSQTICPCRSTDGSVTRRVFRHAWVRDCLRSAKSKQVTKVRVLDPFAGSGTVLLEAEEQDVPSYGVESHPFVARIAQAKITSGIPGRSIP